MELNEKIREDSEDIIEAFNEKPKEGIDIIKRICAGQKLDENQQAEQIALFFTTYKADLDAGFVGDYLGTKENQKVLESFTDQMNFENKEFIDALREYLSAFKLPGEGQKIDRITDTFGKKYHEDNISKKPQLTSPYDTSALASMVITLNVMLHNPAEKNMKITRDQFVKDLQYSDKVPKQERFSKKLLESVYDSIEKTPFAVPTQAKKVAKLKPEIQGKGEEIARRFNRNLDEGIGVIKDICKNLSKDKQDKQIALFFRAYKDNLNLKSVGEYLAKQGNEGVLKRFTGQMELQGVEFTDAFRKYVQDCDIRGKHDKIAGKFSRAFAEEYVKQNPGKNLSADAVTAWAHDMFQLDKQLYLYDRNDKITRKDFIASKERLAFGNKSQVNKKLYEYIYDSVKRKPLERGFTEPFIRITLNSDQLQNSEVCLQLKKFVENPGKSSLSQIFHALHGVKESVFKDINQVKPRFNLRSYRGNITVMDKDKNIVTITMQEPGLWGKLRGEKPNVTITLSQTEKTMEFAGKLVKDFGIDYQITSGYKYKQKEMEAIIEGGARKKPLPPSEPRPDKTPSPKQQEHNDPRKGRTSSVSR